MSYRVLNLTGKRMNEAFDYKEEFEKTGNRKYVLDKDDIKEMEGYTLRTIYKDGSKGGYIEGYDNLSQDGNCKVLDEAMVFDYAEVKDNAKIYGTAVVSWNAKVYGNAKVFKYAQVYGNAEVDYEVSKGKITE